MAISILFTIGAELAFTFYISVYGVSNIIGHFFKLISFFFIYMALIWSGLRRPYMTLFRSLKENEKRLAEHNEHLEQKVIERSLDLESAAHEFESLFNASQVGMMVLKGGRFFHKGNQRLADILGYNSPDELAGFSMESLHLTKKRFHEFGRQHYDRLSLGEVLQVEYELKRKDGSALWCSLSGKALDKTNPADLDKGVLWIIDDISEQKKLEIDLRENAGQSGKVEHRAESIRLRGLP